MGEKHVGMSTDQQQHELYEHARKRVVQKKRLYIHFVLFLVGSLFLFFLNKVLNIGEDFLLDWYKWAIILWVLLFILHAVNVFFFSKFMNVEWERKQTERLILKQELRIAKLEKEFEKEEKLKAESAQFAQELENKKKPEDNQGIL